MFWLCLLLLLVAVSIRGQTHSGGGHNHNHNNHNKHNHGLSHHNALKQEYPPILPEEQRIKIDDWKHFEVIANGTYAKILPCIGQAWMMEGKSTSKFKFPSDAQEHYADIMKRTEWMRNMPIHEYSNYEGPWIENIFIRDFSKKPLHYFRGLIPLFIQWIDTQILRGQHFNHIGQQLEQVLRDDVLYVAVSQGDVGLGWIARRFPNILVLSAGGYGHVPIPLIKSELPWQPLPLGEIKLHSSADASIETVNGTAARKHVRRRLETDPDPDPDPHWSDVNRFVQGGKPQFPSKAVEKVGDSPGVADIQPQAVEGDSAVSNGAAGTPAEHFPTPGTEAPAADSTTSTDNDNDNGNVASQQSKERDYFTGMSAAHVNASLQVDAHKDYLHSSGLEHAADYFHQDLGFFGSITVMQQSREEMFAEITRIAEQLKLKFTFTRQPDSQGNWKKEMLHTKYNLCPRGYGRNSFRFAESIQMGRVPVFLWDDVPWIPYENTNISLEHYGYSAALRASKEYLQYATLPMREANFISLMTKIVQESKKAYHSKLVHLEDARYHYTYEGLVNQIERFLLDPFGDFGGQLRCTRHPREERCCDK